VDEHQLKEAIGAVRDAGRAIIAANARREAADVEYAKAQDAYHRAHYDFTAAKNALINLIMEGIGLMVP
jgi:hypothetical protein